MAFAEDLEEESKKRKEKVITQEVVEAALARLGAGEAPPEGVPSQTRAGTRLSWTCEARDRLNRIPFDFVRNRIIARVEEYAEENGFD